MSTTNANNPPVHRIRYGRITGTIWMNQTERGPMYNLTITRSYQDDQQNWHDTQSFGVSDLTVVAKIALDAHTWISTQKAEDNGSSNGNSNGKANKQPRRQSAGV